MHRLSIPLQLCCRELTNASIARWIQRNHHEYGHHRRAYARALGHGVTAAVAREWLVRKPTLELPMLGSG